MSTCGFINLV